MTAPQQAGLDWVSFEVDGPPISQGSLTAFLHSATGRVVMPQKARVKEYRARVAWAATQARARCTDGPVTLRVVATWARPKSHYRADGRTLTKSAPRHKTSAPDGDKVLRACCDALERVVYYRDSQVVLATVAKRWGRQDSTQIVVHYITVEEN